MMMEGRCDLNVRTCLSVVFGLGVLCDTAESLLKSRKERFLLCRMLIRWSSWFQHYGMLIMTQFRDTSDIACVGLAGLVVVSFIKNSAGWRLSLIT